jgi:hypothetical protein
MRRLIWHVLLVIAVLISSAAAQPEAWEPREFHALKDALKGLAGVFPADRAGSDLSERLRLAAQALDKAAPPFMVEDLLRAEYLPWHFATALEATQYCEKSCSPAAKSRLTGDLTAAVGRAIAYLDAQRRFGDVQTTTELIPYLATPTAAPISLANVQSAYRHHLLLKRDLYSVEAMYRLWGSAPGGVYHWATLLPDSSWVEGFEARWRRHFDGSELGSNASPEKFCEYSLQGQRAYRATGSLPLAARLSVVCTTGTQNTPSIADVRRLFGDQGARSTPDDGRQGPIRLTYSQKSVARDQATTNTVLEFVFGANASFKECVLIEGKP